MRKIIVDIGQKVKKCVFNLLVSFLNIDDEKKSLSRKYFLFIFSIILGFLFHIFLVHLCILLFNFIPKVEMLILVGLIGWLIIFKRGLMLVKNWENINFLQLKFFLLVGFVLGLDLTIFFIMFFPTKAAWFGLPVLPMLCTWVHIIPCYSTLCLFVIGLGVYKTIRISQIENKGEKLVAFIQMEKAAKRVVLVFCGITVVFTLLVFLL